MMIKIFNNDNNIQIDHSITTRRTNLTLIKRRIELVNKWIFSTTEEREKMEKLDLCSRAVKNKLL